jgi:hypothetical protein
MGSTVDRGERNKLLEVKLVVGGSVTINSNLKGRVTFSDSKASACNGSTPIQDCGLPNGTYKAHFEGAARATRDFRIKIAGDSVKKDIRFGVFRAKRGYKIRQGSAGKFRGEVAVPDGDMADIQYIKDGSTAVRTMRVKSKAGRPISLP